MSNILGRDPAAIAAARFGSRLPAVSFTRETVTGYDTASPSSEPTKTSATFVARGTAFSYDQRLVDGELVRKGDYLVTVLLNTITPATATPAPGDLISCPPPNATAPLVGRVIGVHSRTHAAITVQVRGVGAG